MREGVGMCALRKESKCRYIRNRHMPISNWNEEEDGALYKAGVSNTSYSPTARSD
jgi:hypothetical protein